MGNNKPEFFQFNQIKNKKLTRGMSLYWKLYRRWKQLSRIKREIKWRWQRSKYGVADNDTWSFDHHLAMVVIRGISGLRERKIGYPGSLKSWEEWERVLLEIEYGFQQWLIADEQWVNDTEYWRARRALNRSLSLMKEYYGSFWD